MRKDSNGGNTDLGAFSNVFNDGYQNGFNTGGFQFGSPLQTVDSQRTDHFVVLDIRSDGDQNLGSFSMSQFA